MKIKLEKEFEDVMKCPLFVPPNYLANHCSACLYLSKEKGTLVSCAELSGKRCPCLES